VLWFLLCLSSSCVLCIQCGRYLWIVYYYKPPSVFSKLKLEDAPRCSQRLGVSVSCKSKTNCRALKDNWIVIWLKQSNFISNAGSLLRPDQEEFETTGIYYIACPVVLIYIALKHFIWNYSRQTKYNSTTVDTRNTTKERKRHPKHKTNNQEKGIKHYPYFYSQ
jgi:hypothetical protein